MQKTILKQTPEENVYYNFEEEVYFDEFKNNVIIYGNERFESFGDKQLIDVIKGDYYDDDVGYDYETLEELKKLIGKEYEKTTIKGYSQSEWQEVYYTEEITQAELKMIEDLYMGKVQEFKDEDGCYYLIPDDVVWKGKKAMCEFIGFEEEKTVFLKTDSKHVVYDYEEIK